MKANALLTWSLALFAMACSREPPRDPGYESYVRDAGIDDAGFDAGPYDTGPSDTGFLAACVAHARGEVRCEGTLTGRWVAVGGCRLPSFEEIKGFEESCAGRMIESFTVSSTGSIQFDESGASGTWQPRHRFTTLQPEACVRGLGGCANFERALSSMGPMGSNAWCEATPGMCNCTIDAVVDPLTLQGSWTNDGGVVSATSGDAQVQLSTCIADGILSLRGTLTGGTYSSSTAYVFIRAE